MKKFHSDCLSRTAVQVSNQLSKATLLSDQFENVRRQNSLRDALEAAYRIEDQSFARFVFEDILSPYILFYDLRLSSNSLVLHLKAVQITNSSTASLPFFVSFLFSEEGTLQQIIAKACDPQRGILGSYVPPKEPETLSFAKQYLAMIDRKAGIVERVRFRTKNRSWSAFRCVLCYFFQIFPRDVSLRRNRAFFEQKARELQETYDKHCASSRVWHEELQEKTKEALEQIRAFADELGVEFVGG